MVGDEKGNGSFCRVSESLCYWPQCRCFEPQGAGVSKRGDQPLEGEPRPDDADAQDQATAEAAAEAGFYDPLGSRALSLAREAYAASGEVFPDRLVHGQPPKRYYWFKMVDGES